MKYVWHLQRAATQWIKCSHWVFRTLWLKNKNKKTKQNKTKKNPTKWIKKNQKAKTLETQIQTIAKVSL